jgi:glyoxylase-like metal-dependent hydrolase (beta-lactamase superfamily II)
MIARLAKIAAAVAAAALVVLAQQAPPPVRLVPVAGPLYMVEGGGGNIGVVADEAGLLMIDAQFEQTAAGVRQALRPLPGGDRVRLLVDTHWHADHTDGNKAFGPGAAIIAHENVRALLAKDHSLLGRETKALPTAAVPNVTFAEAITAYAGGQAVRLVHYPRAHTNGDTVAFFDGLKAVHMGDMFFNGTFPFLDVANGGDIENWVRHLDAILAGLPADARIIPGHGSLAGTAELKAFRDMLAASADLVHGLIKAGRTLEEIKSTPLPAGLEPWSKGFMKGPRWLELVYQSLTKPGRRP